MSQAEFQWIRDHGKRMDSDLREFLIQRLHTLRWIPCFLQRAVLVFIERFTRVPVLVELEPDLVFSSQVMESILSKDEKRVDYFSSIHTCRLDVSYYELRSLVKRSEIKRIMLDRRVTTCLNTATPVTGAPLAWKGKNRGSKATIAVIDTGIHPHPDLTTPENRIVAFKDFVKGKTDPYDDNGHGTHCTGDAAGNGASSEGKYVGPAPEAPLVGVKVLDKWGSGRLSQVIAGIEWCVANKEKYNIRVLSLSLGSRTSSSYKNDPMAQAAAEAWKKGLVVVAAAGNDGPESGTISTPGIHPSIITVGATDDKGTLDRSDDEVASFSSRGPAPDQVTKPDLVAPGTGVTSLRVKRSFIDKQSPATRVDQHYSTLSGTSMATPIVAGIAALLLTENPDWTPDQVKEQLVRSAESLDLPPDEQGAGQVQVLREWFKE
ncbi:S8 family peptidase [Desmospora profundinema]|uniref:Serine protease AprX n=1 Tax=Desmospora profundinema TaxID=1571184 RepID=A0ABU1IKG5_9BACL|nr:S8 family peptidase [Desmospora profundinema]MDR6225248.1 serine protease AprX [Desmospora profundinema]